MTNVDGLIGKKAQITEKVDNSRGSGTAVLDGRVWAARSLRDDRVFQAGDLVVVKEIRGVKLIVDAAEEGK